MPLAAFAGGPLRFVVLMAIGIMIGATFRRRAAINVTVGGRTEIVVLAAERAELFGVIVGFDGILFGRYDGRTFIRTPTSTPLRDVVPVFEPSAAAFRAPAIPLDTLVDVAAAEALAAHEDERAAEELAAIGATTAPPDLRRALGRR